MHKSVAEKKYWEALERIQNGQAQIVDTQKPKFRISNLSVALEAGKMNPKGYIRPQRYPELCSAIIKANKERQSSTRISENKPVKTEIEKRQAINTRYQKLREENEKLLKRYLNIVRENFELKARLRSLTRS